MKILRRLIQVFAGLALIVALLFPPFKYVWQTSTTSVEGSLGNYYVLKAPDNPIEILRIARKDLASRAEDSTAKRHFDHTKDSISAAIDPGKLLLELIAITGFAAISTWLIDRKLRSSEATKTEA